MSENVPKISVPIHVSNHNVLKHDTSKCFQTYSLKILRSEKERSYNTMDFFIMFI